MKDIIESIKSRIKEEFSEETTGHDWYHIERVYQLASKIQEKEGGNLEIIQLAALLHDISDYKFNGGDLEKGGKVTRQILREYDVSISIQEEVVAIVDNISFKGSGEEEKMFSLEGKIVQDADRIDALGAIGIARTFAYGGATNQMIYNPLIPPKNNQKKESYLQDKSHTINHFYEKLLLLEDRMHTVSGKKIAQERTRFMHEFLIQFYKEWEVSDEI